MWLNAVAGTLQPQCNKGRPCAEENTKKRPDKAAQGSRLRGRKGGNGGSAGRAMPCRAEIGRALLGEVGSAAAQIALLVGNHDFHTAVHGAAFGRVIAGHRVAFAKAAR